MQIKIPKLSLVVLIGPSGSGKSTFARSHFKPTEILASDACRGMVSDSENDQTVTNQAFEVLQFIARKRLSLGRLTVIDATNVQPEARKPLVELARQYHCLPVAIVLDLPERLCLERNRQRAERDFGPHVIRNQQAQLRRSLRGLQREGFRHVFVLESAEEVEASIIERVPLWNDKRDEHGPFDIIGDVHGCGAELEELLARLGYVEARLDCDDHIWGNRTLIHPEGRRAVFLGDLVDRGPRILDTVRLVRNMVVHRSALCVPGNHDLKLVRKLRGKNVEITHGLAETLKEIEALPVGIRQELIKAIVAFLDDLVSHYVLDDGKLVVAHAGMKEEMQGRGSGKVRDFALYGETTGETDEFGLPVRFDWASEYRGQAMVIYGHTPVPEPDWLNRTLNIDTGCVFGGRLTALRYPEKEIVSVGAARTYCEPARPFLAAEERAPALTAQQVHDELLDADDVLGKRIIPTRLRGNVTIREENATAALEVMSRFAADPRWLIYLPPTMSPCETSHVVGLLEHPAEAFAYYRNEGVPKVVCDRFVAAYRQYCWSVETLSDLKLAPFHLLATEGRVHTDKDHLWHMELLAEVCRIDPELLLATRYKVVDVTDPTSQEEQTEWWNELTGRGGEGMVVKPLTFIHKGRRGLSQPAVKCRGREYLRLIYGPDYTSEENLSRLRSRGLGRKRSLALGEFALGVEGLERFVRREPLRRVHECVFGVLALESEPVDPRL